MNLQVPANLSVGSNIDDMIQAIWNVARGEQIIFDLYQVSFICPDRLIMLVTASKIAFEKTQRIVQWNHLSGDVFAYLERIDVIKLGFVKLVRPEGVHLFQRAKHGSNSLVELTTITGWKESGAAIKKTKEVINRWFPEKSIEYRNNLETLLKETVENSVDHSGSHPNTGVCYYVLQKYAPAGKHIQLQIAVGDIGVGMLASLKRVYPRTKDDAAAIQGALIEGKSGRKGGRGGMGYRAIRSALGEVGGNLTIRSGKSIVLYRPNESRPKIYRNNISYQGTQIFFSCGG